MTFAKGRMQLSDLLPETSFPVAEPAGTSVHQYYKDILDRIAASPQWFDDAGVPRYDAFTPQDLADIYAGEAALAEVSCQACGTRFRVALTSSFADRGFSLGDMIRLRRVHYGDPPNIGCCPGGPTMNSEMHTILEYWSRDYEVALDWQRDRMFEGPVGEERLDPPDTIAEVLAAITGGARTIRVACTSRQNRYDLAGRTVAAMMVDGRVLVAFPVNYVVVARRMIEGLIPDEDVGSWKDRRRVTLASFERIGAVRLPEIELCIILAAPQPSNDADRGVWKDAMTRLAATAGQVQVEFVLAHSVSMLDGPDVVIDA